jgi:hypothetical protein
MAQAGARIFQRNAKAIGTQQQRTNVLRCALSLCVEWKIAMFLLLYPVVVLLCSAPQCTSRSDISALLLVLRFALRNRFWAARFARLRPSFIQAGFAISSMQSCQRRIFCYSLGNITKKNP